MRYDGTQIEQLTASRLLCREERGGDRRCNFTYENWLPGTDYSPWGRSPPLRGVDEPTYFMSAVASVKFTFARKGGDLVASLNGGAETAQKAQVRDIFFTPGHGTTPKVFERGDDGKITGFIYLHGKNSIVFKRVV
jgi:hypothetical protein